MNIKAEFQQIKDDKRRTKGDSRLAVVIEVEASPTEAAMFAEMRFANGSTAIPVKLYHFADREVITAATARPVEYRGEVRKNVPCFVKANLPVLSYVPGAMLRLGYPAKTVLGYINPQDHEKTNEWLATELEKIADAIERDISQRTDEVKARSFSGTSTSRKLKTDAHTPPPQPTRPSVTIHSQAGRSVCFV